MNRVRASGWRGRNGGEVTLSTSILKREGMDGSTVTVAALLGLFAILAIYVAGNAMDRLMGVHATVFFGVLAAWLVGIGLWAGKLGDRNPFDETKYELLGQTFVASLMKIVPESLFRKSSSRNKHLASKEDCLDAG